MSQDIPQVSVVIPCYNAVKTLQKAVESVLEQDFTDWELILFDDGSDDGTIGLAEALTAKNPQKIHFFSHSDNKNHGAAVTRNRAIEKARANLIALLDADDTWLPGKLSAQVQRMNKYPEAAMLWGPGQYTYEAHRESYKQKVYIDEKIEYFESPTLLRPWMLHHSGTPCPSGVMLRRDMFLEVGGEEEFIQAKDDVVFYIKFASRYPILYDATMRFRYFVHGDSAVRKQKQGAVKIKIFLNYYKWQMNFIYHEKHLTWVRPLAELQYLTILMEDAISKSQFKGRAQVLLTFFSQPSLLKHYFWSIPLFCFFPFNFAVKAIAKISSWFYPASCRPLSIPPT